MDQRSIINSLREAARGIAPDYPNINLELSPEECLWAITSSYEGVNLANQDMHEFAKFLIQKLGWDIYQAITEYKKFKEQKKNG